MRGNAPGHRRSTAQAKAMYEDLGLCYECGREYKSCTCIPDVFDDLQGEERAAFEILLGVDDTWTDAEHQAAIDAAKWRLEPQTAEEAARAMLIGDPTWEFPWSDAEVASEEINHRPEVSL